MGFTKLAFIRRLRAESIELRIEQTCEGGLDALVDCGVAEEVILFAKGLIDAAREQVLMGKVSSRSST